MTKNNPKCIYDPKQIQDFVNSVASKISKDTKNINSDKQLFYQNFLKKSEKKKVLNAKKNPLEFKSEQCFKKEQHFVEDTGLPKGSKLRSKSKEEVLKVLDE